MLRPKSFSRIFSFLSSSFFCSPFLISSLSNFLWFLKIESGKEKKEKLPKEIEEDKLKREEEKRG